MYCPQCNKEVDGTYICPTCEYDSNSPENIMDRKKEPYKIRLNSIKNKYNEISAGGFIKFVCGAYLGTATCVGTGYLLLEGLIKYKQLVVPLGEYPYALLSFSMVGIIINMIILMLFVKD